MDASIYLSIVPVAAQFAAHWPSDSRQDTGKTDGNKVMAKTTLLFATVEP